MKTTRPRYRPPAVPDDALALIRRRITYSREAAGLSPERLSAAAGLSPAAVRLIEGGYSAPSLGTLYALAGPLGLHPADLIRPGEKNRKNPSPAIDTGS